jgi:hypothetical protein
MTEDYIFKLRTSSYTVFMSYVVRFFDLFKNVRQLKAQIWKIYPDQNTM